MVAKGKGLVWPHPNPVVKAAKPINNDMAAS